MKGCSWWNFWCRNRVARKLEIQAAVEEAIQNLPEQVAAVIESNSKKESEEK